MSQSLASLHPNPGWQTAPIGKHCILELYHCNADRLNDETFLRSRITSAVERAGAHLLQLITHRFEPQGITGLALLAESHLSIHTWPESGYAAVDVFTCGDHTMPEQACRQLVHDLEAAEHSLRSFQRETAHGIHSAVRLPKGQSNQGLPGRLLA